MIIITMSQRIDGMDVAEAEVDGQGYSEASRHGAVLTLCRALFAAWVPDQPWEAIGTNGAVRMRGGSIYAAARLTAAEGDRRKGEFVPWQTIETEATRCLRCGAEGAVFRGRCIRCGMPPAMGLAKAPPLAPDNSPGAFGSLEAAE